MSKLPKYRKLARRSCIAGIIIWTAWAIIAAFFIFRIGSVVLFYLSTLAQWLIAVLTIPAIIIGLWGLRGLSKRELNAKYIAYALFGIISGIMSIVMAAKLIVALAYSLD